MLESCQRRRKGAALALAVLVLAGIVAEACEGSPTKESVTQTSAGTLRKPAAPSAMPFPGPSSVGHLADLPGFNVPARNLAEHVGDFTTSYDGQVVEGLHVTGAVVVKNRDVVVRRNRIELGVWAIPDGSHPNVSARVEWNTIGPSRGDASRYVAGNGRGENLYFYRNELFGGIDLFNFNKSGNVTIEENWAYGAYQKRSDPYQRGGLSHSDGIQVHRGGAHYHVVRNRFDLFLFRSGGTARSNLGRFPNVAPMTTGFLFQQGAGALDDIVFDGNRIDGDYYRVMSFPRNERAEGPTNVRIVNNTFVRRTPTFGQAGFIDAASPGDIVFSGNVDETGARIPRPEGMRAADAAAATVDQFPIIHPDEERGHQ